MKWNRAALRACALCAALVMTAGLLAACSGSDSSSASAGTPPASSAATGSSQPAADSGSQSTSTAAPAAALTDTQVSYQGLVFGLNDDAAPILAELGEPVNYSENISCMFEGGMDKTYEYEDLTLYTYPNDAGEELILLIDITSPEVETSRGVKVGDGLDSAQLAYNDVLVPESDTRYTATFGDIYFVIMGADGAVERMSFEQDAKL